MTEPWLDQSLMDSASRSEARVFTFSFGEVIGKILIAFCVKAWINHYDLLIWKRKESKEFLGIINYIISIQSSRKYYPLWVSSTLKLDHQMFKQPQLKVSQPLRLTILYCSPRHIHFNNALRLFLGLAWKWWLTKYCSIFVWIALVCYVKRIQCY